METVVKLTHRIGLQLAGLLVLVVLATTAWWLAAWMRSGPSGLPISPMVLAILAGLVLAGVTARRPGWQPGLHLARGPLLKTAVALIGLRLSLSELAWLGNQALPLVLTAVVLGLAVTLGLARLAGAGSRLAGLLAVGTVICGVSAIAALAPAVKARHEEVCYAIACIALAGLVGTLVYPFALPLLLTDPIAAGLVLGTAIHDTAQVTAAATAWEQLWGSEDTLNAAIATKLMRNLTMVLVIPAMAWLLAERGDNRRVAVPLFIVAFVGLSALRSLGDLAGADQTAWWPALIDGLAVASQFMFTMAMAALAMSIRLGDLKALGWRPAAAAMIAAFLVLLLAVFWVRQAF